jgi:Mg-chelatase subunit ChlI
LARRWSLPTIGPSCVRNADSAASSPRWLEPEWLEEREDQRHHWVESREFLEMVEIGQDMEFNAERLCRARLDIRKGHRYGALALSPVEC